MAARPVSIVPSVLPADFSRLGDECIALEKAGVDRIQWDVMDGQFVPNLTFGPDVIAACRSAVTIPFEAHLMVNTPEVLAERYVEAGCNLLLVHVESTVHLHRTLGAVAEAGARAAVALNPSTPIDRIPMPLAIRNSRRSVTSHFADRPFPSPASKYSRDPAGGRIV